VVLLIKCKCKSYELELRLLGLLGKRTFLSFLPPIEPFEDDYLGTQISFDPKNFLDKPKNEQKLEIVILLAERWRSPNFGAATTSDC